MHGDTKINAKRGAGDKSELMVCAKYHLSQNGLSQNGYGVMMMMVMMMVVMMVMMVMMMVVMVVMILIFNIRNAPYGRKLYTGMSNNKEGD